MTIYYENPETTTDVRSVSEIKKLCEILFLAEVTLMFVGLFLVADNTWFFVVFHVVATVFAIFVLRTAYRAARVIPASIPFQRPIGVTLYVTGHLIQFCYPGQLPIGLVGVLLITCPLAVIFLFEP